MNRKCYPIIGLSERLNIALGKSGLTIREVCKRTQYSERNFYELLNGSTPSVQTLAGLCKALNVSADYLLFGDENDTSTVKQVNSNRKGITEA